jgi:hypothetical protein
MNRIAFRRAYHRPTLETERIDQHHAGPLPLYVEPSDYLNGADFVSAKRVEGEPESTVSVLVTLAGMEKLNQIAALNARAGSLEDYVGLLRYLDGVRADHLLMVFDPLTDDEVWLNRLTDTEADAIVEAINRRTAR